MGLRQIRVSIDLWTTPSGGTWERQINIPCIIQQGGAKQSVTALVDTGATGLGFIHRDLARNLKLRLQSLPYEIQPTGFNGKQL